MNELTSKMLKRTKKEYKNRIDSLNESSNDNFKYELWLNEAYMDAETCSTVVFVNSIAEAIREVAAAVENEVEVKEVEQKTEVEENEKSLGFGIYLSSLALNKRNDYEQGCSLVPNFKNNKVYDFSPELLEIFKTKKEALETLEKKYASEWLNCDPDFQEFFVAEVFQKDDEKYFVDIKAFSRFKIEDLEVEQIYDIYDEQIIDDNVFEELQEDSRFNFENCGYSGTRKNCEFWVFKFSDDYKENEGYCDDEDADAWELTVYTKK